MPQQRITMYTLTGRFCDLRGYAAPRALSTALFMYSHNDQ